MILNLLTQFFTLVINRTGVTQMVGAPKFSGERIGATGGPPSARAPKTWKVMHFMALAADWQIVNLTLNIESIKLWISSQFDSEYWVILILNIESVRFSISSHLTLNMKSIWLSISSQFDSQYRVSLTLNIESIWLKCSLITRNPGSIFSSASESTF